MKIINYIMMIFIVFSSLYSIDKGYYIYKFGIDSNDSISLYNSKFIDAKLKVSQVEKHIHNPILYKLINTENDILFEGGLINPKIVYYEDMIDEIKLFDQFIENEEKKSLAFEVTIRPKINTLTEDEIEKISVNIISSVENATGGKLRG